MTAFEKLLYKPNWIYTRWTTPPQWVINIGNEILESIQSKNLYEKIACDGKRVTRGQCLAYKIAKEAGLTWKELDSFFPITKKNLKKLLSLVYEKDRDPAHALWIYWLFQFYGFQAGTKHPATYSPKDFNIPDSILRKKNKLIKDLQDGKIDAETFEIAIKELAKDLIEQYKKEGLTIADIIFSGSAKNEISNIQRMMIARGLSITSDGRVNAVVTSSLAEGAKPEDYIAGTSEAITSLYSKSHFTASGGYLARLLTELVGPLRISMKEDCGTKNYFEIHIDSADLAKAIINRYDDKKQLITKSPKVGSKVKLRSPLYCIAEDGICMTCLGEHFRKLGYKPGDPLLIVSTSIADALTAVALKRSHVGSSLNALPIDFEKEIFG